MADEGVRAEGRAVSQSYLQSLTNYIPSVIPSSIEEITGYLPESVRQRMASFVPPPPPNKDSVLWTSFERLAPDNRLLLLIGYEDGFQVWDLDQVRELASKRGVCVKASRLLPAPTGGALANQGPVLALCAQRDTSQLKTDTVAFYALASQSFVATAPMPGPVLGLAVHGGHLAACLHDKVALVDLDSMEIALTVPTFPCPTTWGVLALGARHLAYPSPVAPGKGPAVAGGQTTSEALVGAAKDLARELYTGLSYLGDLGVKTMQAESGDEDNGGNGVAGSEDEGDFGSGVAGSVCVRDVQTNRVVALLRPHGQPICALAFDPSGQMLVTACVSGHHVNVIRLGAEQPTHLYKLSRGITNALIEDITFSLDSRWLAVSSTRGTTHLYAIDPLGGPVDARTHVHGHRGALPRRTAVERPEPVRSAALHRIKQGIQFAQPQSNQTKHFSIPSIAAFTGPRHAQDEHQIMIVTRRGTLYRYNLVPAACRATGPNDDPHRLKLLVEPLAEWDVCREKSWTEVTRPITDIRETLLSGSPKRAPPSSPPPLATLALAQIEIETHRPVPSPWAPGMLTVETFVAADAAAAADDDASGFHYYETLPSRPLEIGPSTPTPAKGGAVQGGLASPTTATVFRNVTAAMGENIPSSLQSTSSSLSAPMIYADPFDDLPAEAPAAKVDLASITEDYHGDDAPDMDMLVPDREEPPPLSVREVDADADAFELAMDAADAADPDADDDDTLTMSVLFPDGDPFDDDDDADKTEQPPPVVEEDEPPQGEWRVAKKKSRRKNKRD